MSHSGHASSPSPLGRSRPALLSFIHLLLAAALHAAKAHAAPLNPLSTPHKHDNGKRDSEDPEVWIYLTTAVLLVLLGGAFAGLTIALMGQDEVYLQVIATSGEGSEKKNATKVLGLLQKGKHWVLVTLLVGNVITNETLPIVLDRSIGGGYAAAIASTLLVIIFGEIVPQSICVRFGLPIGAWMANFVLLLMWIFAPVTWPTAKLLDWLLGKDHGTVYKKAGLKTLVTLHKTLGAAPGERLNEDEVSIISGVLDLKEKPVGRIMTPMNDVFTLPSDAVLDEDMMDEIMREGYSRIPIHQPKNRGDFVGMLLVKMLITYDPEDARKVHEFSLATLPETKPETSCLDIINFFQQGKSHMVLVSDFPGKPYGALGVVTLEDVIEELIGEEIIDESDVFIDVHKAIRRIAPAPTHRARIKMDHHENSEHAVQDDEMSHADEDGSYRPPSKRASITSDHGRGSEYGRSPRPLQLLMRRKSSQSAGTDGVKRVEVRQYTPEMKQQLRSLGPSNAASKPKASRVGTVTIKTPGVPQIPENSAVPPQQLVSPTTSKTITIPEPTAAQDGIGHDLLSPGLDARDGVQAIHTGNGSYGSMNGSRGSPKTLRERKLQNSHTGTSNGSPGGTKKGADEPHSEDGDEDGGPGNRERRGSHSTIGSIRSGNDRDGRPRRLRKGTARSGSITENFVEAGGVRKLVLETTSSSEEGGEAIDALASASTTDEQPKPGEIVVASPRDGRANKKKKRKAKKKSAETGSSAGEAEGNGKDGSDERTPLLR